MKRLAYVAISIFTLLLLPNCGGQRYTANIPPPGPTPTPSDIAVSVAPIGVVLDQGATKQFSANVTGTTNLNVTWSIQEGSTGGTITPAGLYTAPSAAGDFTVVATSVADSTKHGSVTVSVSQIFLYVDPRGVSLLPNATRQFTGSVYGSVNKSQSWRVKSGAGSVTTDGLFTAPPTVGGPTVLEVTFAVNPTDLRTAQVFMDTRGFHATGDMVQLRTAHTATRLANGNVLIAGGVGQAGSPDPGAEIYDATAGVFQAVAPMTEVRYGHTATLLANGMVLITGGASALAGCTACSSHTAELYDPVTQTFTPTGNMTIERSFHAAALLSNGTVLITGGASNTAPRIETAEIYDPSTGQFTAVAASMATKRSSHTATTLQSGKVLVAGGEGSSNVEFTGEVFDVANGSFTTVHFAPRSRNAHTATLLPDGTVLLAAGGVVGANLYPNSHVFSPSTGVTSPDIALYNPRMFHAASLLNAATDQVLLTGGQTAQQNRSVKAEIFESGVFRDCPDMLNARAQHRTTLLVDGSVLITGGSTSKTAELFK